MDVYLKFKEELFTLLLLLKWMHACVLKQKREVSFKELFLIFKVGKKF